MIFLLVGFVLGFALFYTWTKQRAPQIVQATPLPLELSAPSSGSAGASSIPAPPPVDMAHVRGLQDRVKSNPKDFAALVELGNINFDQRNFADAEKWYRSALEVQPNDAELHTNLGATMLYNQRYDDAIAEFHKSLALDPNHADTMLYLGAVLLKGKNDPQGALQVWEKLVATNPDFPQIALVKEQIQAIKQSIKKSAP